MPETDEALPGAKKPGLVRANEEMRAVAADLQAMRASFLKEKNAPMSADLIAATDETLRTAQTNLHGIKMRLETMRGGGKLSRTETVTVRLDPRLRYLAELAARKQRRTLSSFIEWAVEKSLRDVVLTTQYSGDDLTDEEVETLADKAAELWDVDPSERFARLAISHPSLLVHDEQLLWKQIEDSGALAGGWIPPTKDGIYRNPGSPNWAWLKETGFPRLRDHWETLCAVAEGRLDRSHLPRFSA